VKARVDVVVVGAGIGGLTAAIYLGAAGLGVRVIERGARVGGKAGVQVIDGVEVDTGPSLLTLPGVFEHVFAAAGREFSRAVELLQPTPAFRYVFADGTDLCLDHDLDASLSAVARCLSPRAASELRQYLDRARGIWEVAAPEFVFAPAPRLRTLAGLGPHRLSRFARIDALSSLERGITRTVVDPRLRDVLRRFATYSGSDVRHAPGTMACITHVELALGAFGVRGGLHALAAALEQAARAVGVEFEFGRSVREVRVSGSAAVGVCLEDGNELDASEVVLNADAGALRAGLFGEPIRRIYDRRSVGTPSMSAYTGIIRAKRRKGRSPHTVLFPPDYLQEFVEIFDRGRTPTDPAIYICALEAAHGRRGWAEHEPLFVMINAPAVSSRREPDSAEQVRDGLLRSLVERGQIERADELVWWRTPDDLAREFPGSQGALYGEAFHGPWAAFRRPGSEVSGIDGLYLASGSGHPGGGVPLAAQSGKQAAEAILRERRISA
jgi:1-hydroxycarotenoid 3,4-desaturase